MTRRQKDLFPELPDGKKYLSDIPELVAEWHPTKNEGKSPEDYTIGSNQKLWWMCSKGHEWQATVHHRSSGGGCLACFNENRSEIMRPKTSADFNLFTENPTVCADWDYEKNEYPPTHYLPTSAAKVHWKCSAGDDHSWAARIDSRTLPDDGVKNKCPFCTGRKPSKGYNLAVINPYLVAEWHSEKNKKSPSDYTPSSNQKVWWICEKGHEWEAAINNRSAGRNCPQCSNKSSRNEVRILTELKALFPKVLSRQKIGQYEVDIFLSDLSIAIEYDGRWWHRDSFEKDTKKQSGVEEHGIRLLRIREEPLPQINPDDIFVDGGQPISKEDVGRIVEAISPSVSQRYSAHEDFINDADYRTYLDYFPNPFPENSLAVSNPELASEWHPTKNEPLTPANFYPNTAYKAWWQCPKGHEYQASVNNRNGNNRGCPYCSGRYATPETCMATTHPELVNIFHPSKNGELTPHNLKAGTGRRLWWLCECGHEWQAVGHTMRGRSCPACGGKEEDPEGS